MILAKTIWNLAPFSFRLEEYGAIFYVVAGFTIMKHVVQRPECLQASVTTVAPARCAASLTVLSGPLVEGGMVPFLRWWSKILFLVFRWPTTIEINAMHRLGVIALIVIIVRRPWSIILLWSFPLLLKLAKILNLRVAQFCKLLIELWHCSLPLPD
jgi:hypothetical protein